jgi:hypothetical protein
LPTTTRMFGLMKACSLSNATVFQEAGKAVAYVTYHLVMIAELARILPHSELTPQKIEVIRPE